MSPSPNWYSAQDQNGLTEYHWSDGAGADATAWQENGQWKLMYAPATTFGHHDLGEAPSVEDALERAEQLIDRLDQRVSMKVHPEDARALIELAATVDDLTPHERNAIDRVQRVLDEHERNMEQSLDWASDRSQNQSQNRGRTQ
jgi:hypothetical protein